MKGVTIFFFISQNVAVCPKTFSSRVWQSLLMACSRYIHWYYISYLSAVTIDCVGLLIHEVIGSHTTTHQSRQNSGRVVSSSQRPLPGNTHITRNRQTSMPPVGFEPVISAVERPQTYSLDRSATGTGVTVLINCGCWQETQLLTDLVHVL
jgi:hypothetical protein